MQTLCSNSVLSLENTINKESSQVKKGSSLIKLRYRTILQIQFINNNSFCASKSVLFWGGHDFSTLTLPPSIMFVRQSPLSHNLDLALKT